MQGRVFLNWLLRGGQVRHWVFSKDDFSKASIGMLVSCGVSETAAYALCMITERFYTETVIYACLIGGIFDGKGDGKS